jgi:hypothetical protein
VVGVHMANPSWFKKPRGITVGANDSTFSKTAADKSPGGG